MTVSGWVTIFAFVLILTALALPLGRYMAAVYTGERTFLDPDHAATPSGCCTASSRLTRTAVRTGSRMPRA